MSQTRRRLEVALVGAAPAGWHSIARTHAFYREALSRDFRVHDVESFDVSPTVFDPCDVILAFAPALGNPRVPRGRCPVLYPVFGGAVLDYQRLRGITPGLCESERLIVNCRSDARIFAGMSAEQVRRCELLPLPVDAKVFAPVARRRAKDAVGLAHGALTIGFVGRLIPEKNFHVFLQLLAALRRRHGTERVTGVVVGDFWADYPGLHGKAGRYHEYAMELAESLGVASQLKMFSAGLQSDQLNLVYNAIDVLVHPTMCVDENFGYVPLEAMAAGTPVVATAYGGLKDTLAECGAAVIEPTWVTPGGIRADWRMMESDVVAVLSSEAERARRSRIAARYVRARFSTRVAADTLRDIVVRAATGESVPRWRGVDSGSVPMPASSVPRTAGREGSARGARPGGRRRSAGRATRMPAKWAQLVTPVSHYVSRRVPQLKRSGSVTPYAPIRLLRGGRVRLEDPLWPAEYAISGAQRQAIRTIGAGCARVSDLLANGSTLETLQRLVDLGLLVPGRASERTALRR